MLKIASGYQRKAFGYAETMVSECWKRHPDTKEGYSNTKRASRYSATEFQEQRTNNDSNLKKTNSIYDIMLGNQTKKH